MDRLEEGIAYLRQERYAEAIQCLEAVLAARSPKGDLLGVVVNFSCHPVHEGAGTGLSAGYPGVLAHEIGARGCPLTIFLNGASGNIHYADPCRSGAELSREEVGQRLAEDVERVLPGLEFRSECHLDSRRRTIELPYRQATEAEIEGKIRRAQRFVDPATYDRHIPGLLERIRLRGTQPAEVQALFMDEYVYAGIPAEFFVEFGLRIKEAAYPRHALVVGHANGMVGYVPTWEAFPRGGYETTFAPSSRLAPEAGDLLTQCAIELIKEVE